MYFCKTDMAERLYIEGNRNNILDDRHQILNIYGSQCAVCKHFVEDDYYCSAYPDGIPDELLDGSQKHDKTRQDQTGSTIFEPEN